MKSQFKPIADIFANRSYAVYQVGQVTGYLSIWMQRIAVGWLAWDLTHSSVWLGLMAAADLAPALILAPFAGAIADRVHPLKQLRAGQLLTAAHGIALTAFMHADRLQIELLWGLAIFLGLVAPFQASARFSVIPALVSRPQYPTAVALDSTFFQASRSVGPAIAALMIPLAGAEGVFLVSALGACLYWVTLQAIHFVPPSRNLPTHRNLFRDVAESFSYVRGHEAILPLLLVLAVVSVFARPVQDMLPAFAGEVFRSGAVGLAWLASAMGLGAMLSAVSVALRSGLTPSGIVLGCLGVASALAGFIATERLWVGVIFAIALGFCFNSITTRIQALIQSTVVDKMRSRVMSLYMLVFRGMPALGGLLYGVAADSIGLRVSFVAGASACLLAWLFAGQRRRAIDDAMQRY